jgi:predicted nucleotidyltransferase
MVDFLSRYEHKIARLFRQCRIERAYIFGSAAKGALKENSDLDFLIKFEEGIEPLERGELWWNLHDSLRDLFNREIDLITENSLKNPYFIQEIEETKSLIYEQ